MNDPIRCHWVNNHPLYQRYHDTEWGQPQYASHDLFEQLCLEGQQAGLSWWTVLQKREHYRQQFFRHSLQQMAMIDAAQLDQLVQDPGLIRHRAKLAAIVHNANAWLTWRQQLQQQPEPVSAEVQGLPCDDAVAQQLWQIALAPCAELLNDLRPAHRQSISALPPGRQRSQLLAHRLKKKCFVFVGPETCHAFMQAVGMLQEHDPHCEWVQPAGP